MIGVEPDTDLAARSESAALAIAMAAEDDDGPEHGLNLNLERGVGDEAPWEWSALESVLDDRGELRALIERFHEYEQAESRRRKQWRDVFQALTTRLDARDAAESDTKVESKFEAARDPAIASGFDSHAHPDPEAEAASDRERQREIEREEELLSLRDRIRELEAENATLREEAAAPTVLIDSAIGGGPDIPPHWDGELESARLQIRDQDRRLAELEEQIGRHRRQEEELQRHAELLGSELEAARQAAATTAESQTFLELQRQNQDLRSALDDAYSLFEVCEKTRSRLEEETRRNKELHRVIQQMEQDAESWSRREAEWNRQIESMHALLNERAAAAPVDSTATAASHDLNAAPRTESAADPCEFAALREQLEAERQEQARLRRELDRASAEMEASGSLGQLQEELVLALETLDHTRSENQKLAAAWEDAQSRLRAIETELSNERSKLSSSVPNEFNREIQRRRRELVESSERERNLREEVLAKTEVIRLLESDIESLRSQSSEQDHKLKRFAELEALISERERGFQIALAENQKIIAALQTQLAPSPANSNSSAGSAANRLETVEAALASTRHENRELRTKLDEAIRDHEALGEARGEAARAESANKRLTEEIERSRAEAERLQFKIGEQDGVIQDLKTRLDGFEAARVRAALGGTGLTSLTPPTIDALPFSSSRNESHLSIDERIRAFREQIETDPGQNRESAGPKGFFGRFLGTRRTVS